MIYTDGILVVLKALSKVMYRSIFLLSNPSLNMRVSTSSIDNMMNGTGVEDKSFMAERSSFAALVSSVCCFQSTVSLSFLALTYSEKSVSIRYCISMWNTYNLPLTILEYGIPVGELSRIQKVSPVLR